MLDLDNTIGIQLILNGYEIYVRGTQRWSSKDKESFSFIRNKFSEKNVSDFKKLKLSKAEPRKFEQYLVKFVRDTISSSGGSQSSNSDFNKWSFFELYNLNIRNSALRLHLDVAKFIPKLFFVNTQFEFSNKQYRVQDRIPTNPDHLQNIEGLFSLFHYGTRSELKSVISDITEWAAKFGYTDLLHNPEQNAEISISFEDLDGNSMNVFLGGFGIKSLLRIISVCCIAKENDVIVIDEPELHLHATSQAVLVDLLIDTIQRGIQVVTATHSEYMLLRIQRRVTDGTLNLDDISINEVIKSKKGSKIINLKLAKDGTYESKIPEVMEFARKELQFMMNSGEE